MYNLLLGDDSMISDNNINSGNEEKPALRPYCRLAIASLLLPLLSIVLLPTLFYFGHFIIKQVGRGGLFVALFLSFMLLIVGFVCACLARKKIRQKPALKGKWLAATGLITGIPVLVFYALLFLYIAGWEYTSWRGQKAWKIPRSDHDDSAWTQLCEKAAAIRIGMTQSEVIALMGEPDLRAAKDPYQKKTWDAFWYKVKWDIPGADPSEVYIEFDPSYVRTVEIQPNFSIPFNSEDWKKSSAIRRGCMIYDLLERYDLNHMTKEEITGLLSTPEPTGYFRDWDYVYNLGPNHYHGPGLDDDWLVIDFEPDGQVRQHRIVSD